MVSSLSTEGPNTTRKLESLIEKFFSKSDPKASNTAHKHSNNWVVLIDTSRFWFNYRHVANTLSIYHIAKNLGIPDSQILLMLADDVACNPRNRFPGEVFNNKNRQKNLYGENVEVDYRGYEVTVENFFRVLTGRHHEAVPTSKRLMSDEHSNVLLFMTGHGGDEFFKFQDQEEINSADIADVIHQMSERRRFREMLMIVDTCQAGSLFDKLYTPNVIAVGSSKRGENSYSHHSDLDIGVAVIDRFTYSSLEFFENRDFRHYSPSLRNWFNSYTAESLHSTPNMRYDLYPRNLDTVPITDFFGSDIKIEFQDEQYPRGNATLLSSYKPVHTNEEYKIAFPSSNDTAVEAQETEVTFENNLSIVNKNIIALFIFGVLICLFLK
nr:unnamed protein product [Naegleria fowleri]